MTQLPFPRRVVAADGPGGEIVAADDRVIETARTPVEGLQTRLIWATEAGHDYRTPIDQMPVPKGIAPLPGGSRFSILDIAPGHHGAALHRTDTLDYVLCLSGSIDMLLDSGAVTLHAGDVAVQCGTNHGWANTTSAPARVAVILLDAQPKREASISGAGMAP